MIDNWFDDTGQTIEVDLLEYFINDIGKILEILATGINASIQAKRDT